MSAKKIRVSLCMIVRNEETNLDACLGPVAALFDEIVIVDTGSCDDTKKIASRYTSQVFDFAWCDDFSAARNEALMHASGEWIFWLDADDRIRGDQIERLRRTLAELDERPRAFLIETLLLQPEDRNEVECVTHVRLFRRHDEMHWQGRVHEQLVPDPSTLGYEWVYSDLKIEHVGYQESALAERKARRKQRLLRMDYAVDPNDPSTLFHLGMSLRTTRHVEEAEMYLRRLIEVGTDRDNFLRWACNALIRLAAARGKPHEALQVANCALTRFPDDEQLQLSLATVQFTLEQYSQTAATLARLIACPSRQQMHFEAPAHLRTKVAPRMLATVCRLQGHFREAEAILQGILQAFPTDIMTWYGLGLLYLDVRQRQALDIVVSELMKIPGGKLEAGLLSAIWHLRIGDPRQAGPIIEELIASEPQATRPRMLRAEWLSRTGSSLDSQIQSLRDILRIEPGNVEATRWLQLAERANAATAQPVGTQSFAPPAVPAGAAMPVNA